MVRQKHKLQVAQAITVLIGLTIVYAVLALVANVVFNGNALVQTFLLSLGAAILASGIAYFLIKVYGLEQVHKAVRMFTALTVVFVMLVLLTLLLFASNTFVYTLLLTTGAAIFAGSLTFFLIKLT
jgi:hypothetical protein